ncbi:hypothetical protein RU01_02305 [Rhodococcus sp. MEB064]|nr:hypothetical protein RU01_02305 [Rhodococcus sp. MEB064]
MSVGSTKLMPMWKKTIAWTIGTASATGVVVFGVLGLIHHWGSGQFGPLAAWVSGAGTLAAVTIALWQAQRTNQRAVEDARNAEERLDEERKRHKEQLQAQRVAVMRREQIEAGKEIAASLRQIWRLTDNFTWSFRLESESDIAKDTYLDGVTDYSDVFSSTEHSIELARLGIFDETLLGNVETGLKRARKLRGEIVGVGLAQLVNWDSYDNSYEEVGESVRIITTYLNAALNPVYLRYIRKQLDEDNFESSV